MSRAVGFRAHTGWAAAVIIDGGALSQRLRCELLPGGDRGWGAAYHRARDEGGTPAKAAAIVAEVESAAEDMAGLFLDQLDQPDVVGVVLGNMGELPELEKVLASHTLCHAGEGVLYREALIAAANARDIEVTARAERDVKAFAAASNALATLGRNAGPPWAEDQKLAAAIALIALGHEQE